MSSLVWRRARPDLQTPRFGLKITLPRQWWQERIQPLHGVLLPKNQPCPRLGKQRFSREPAEVPEPPVDIHPPQSARFRRSTRRHGYRVRSATQTWSAQPPLGSPCEVVCGFFFPSSVAWGLTELLTRASAHFVHHRWLKIDDKHVLNASSPPPTILQPDRQAAHGQNNSRWWVRQEATFARATSSALESDVTLPDVCCHWRARQVSYTRPPSQHPSCRSSRTAVRSEIKP